VILEVEKGHFIVWKVELIVADLLLVYNEIKIKKHKAKACQAIP